MRKRRFLTNAAIMSATSFLINTVGISFNVYMSNKIGASGVGLFQLIMSVYGFSITLASSGINLAATRLITDEIALSKNNAASYIMKRCLFYAFCFGTLSFSLLFFGADFIAKNLLCDTRVIKSLKALSISMPPIAMSSAMSGYFMATRQIFKSSSAQIFEQAVKIFVTVSALEMYIGKGIEYACLCMIAGGSIAEISSFLFMLILYQIDKRRYSSDKIKKDTYPAIFKIALPIALSTYLRSALVTIEHLLIPRGLKKSGMDNETALKCYGTIHGMALPLLLFPSSILKSLSSLLVPEISECAALGHHRQINNIISKTLKNTLFFSIGLSGIFYCFAEEIGTIVYKSSAVTLYIRLLSPLCVIMYIDGIVDGMLKGLNQQVNSMIYNIIDSIVSIMSLLIFLPRFAGDGYIMAIYISEILNAFLSLNRLIKITDFYVDYIKWIFLPVISVYGAGSVVRLISKFFIGTTPFNIIHLVFQLLSCILIYALFLFSFNYNTKTKHGN